jgi:hypothetical protein
MRVRLFAAVIIGLILGGLGTSALSTRAQGQAKEKARQWEYKVIFSTTGGNDSAAEMTEKYNKLAEDRWEYVGPIVESTTARNPSMTYAGITGIYIMFRRIK